MADKTKQELSGKGRTRVEIAETAWRRAQDKADAAKKRLEAAIAAAEAGAGKKKETRQAKAERAAKALERAGMTELAAKARKEAGIMDKAPGVA